MPQDSHISNALEQRIDVYLASVGLGFNPYLTKREGLMQAAALDAKSDEELARMGLVRDDIPARVFRDLAA